MAKILIVDDDERLVSVYAMALRSSKYEVDTAPTGDIGIAKINEFKPDLVVLDAMMPAMSGVEVLETIRKTPDIEKLKVIMFTAVSDDRMKEQVLALGVSDYIVKSQLTIVEVVERVDKALNAPS
jgi:DNA-binding response OmpR family regulator